MIPHPFAMGELAISITLTYCLGRTSYFNHTHRLLRNVRRILWIGEMVDFDLNLGSIMVAYVWSFCSTIHVFLAHNEGWFINGKGLPFLSYVLLSRIHSVIPLLFRLESMYNYELFILVYILEVALVRWGELVSTLRTIQVNSRWLWGYPHCMAMAMDIIVFLYICSATMKK